MAEDVLILLDYVGWTEPRGLHVVGISMGGMIAQGEPFHRVHLSYTNFYYFILFA